MKKRITVDLEETQFRELRIVSAERGEPVTAIIRNLLAREGYIRQPLSIYRLAEDFDHDATN